MIKRCWILAKSVVIRFFQEGCPAQAAGLSYVSLLSLVPLMTVSLLFLAAFPAFHGLREQVQSFIVNNFISSSAQAMIDYLQTFVQQTAKLSATGMVFLVVTAVLMIFSMEQAFNHIWQVKKRRKIIQAFLMYWAVLTLTPLLIGAGVAVSSYVMGLKFLSGAVAIPWIKQVMFTLAPYTFTFLAFMLLYITIPNCKVKVRYAALGALFATVLFELAKSGFTIYITNFPTYKLIYGALAVVPIFLVWLYVSWMIILFGAIISNAIGTAQGTARRTHTD